MKKVTWDEPLLQNPASPYLAKGPSFRDITAKWESSRIEQEARAEFIAKAKPGMLAIMELKIRSNEAFKVLHPIQYRGSTLDVQSGRFQESMNIIHPGSEVIVKSISPQTSTWILEDNQGQEHEIAFSEQEALMFCTDVYQTVESFLKGIEE
jgi:hypothetical protein